jgi:hypothetical protein
MNVPHELEHYTNKGTRERVEKIGGEERMRMRASSESLSSRKTDKNMLR